VSFENFTRWHALFSKWQPRLQAFLEDPRRPAGTLRYHELQGFLFAVASSPERVTPSEWMPIVFGDAEPEYGSIDEAGGVTGELMTLYTQSTPPFSLVVLRCRQIARSEPSCLRTSMTHRQYRCGRADSYRVTSGSRMSGMRIVPSELDDELAASLRRRVFSPQRKLPKRSAPKPKARISPN
jgi:hypothetical protein